MCTNAVILSIRTRQFEDPPASVGFLPALLGNGYLGRRAATAFKSVPVERGFVEPIPCPDTKQLAASVGGLGQSHLPRFDGLLIIEFQKLAAILACL